MSDDERIARLTELARRVYGPDAVLVFNAKDDVRVKHSLRVIAGAAMWTEALCIRHPRALDALEAALLVLEDADVKVTSRTAFHEAVHVAANKIDESRAAWVEQLAAWMERNAEAVREAPPDSQADDAYTSGVADGMLRCAAELRARAKGGERG